MAVQFEAVYGLKFMAFCDDAEDPYSCQHLTDCRYHVSFRRHRPLKLSLSCEVVQKLGLGQKFVGGGDTADFGHAFYFRACGRFWMSFVQRAPRLGGDKKKKEKESVVKHKSADRYA